ncbi:lipocalin-like domain-containing protein [Mycolicibacillus parakoreensis]|uniref:Lipocalin-like domain-containing protein n=1 Tax=Mycolicibacillus parakoreensis TaxID=1069221 RepID=A0ABY3U6M7_9MYCO|nr:lipocalin-like domain-containing protein [Mycolicibacillus parakoreensis]MCV7314750.1 lipocalin-like domain-containing protein [Mycolicibacillus parakoreensis]ULN53756.1 lipocalin-like domain-containing protein [Mycolicibacillus parakoreensis]
MGLADAMLGGWHLESFHAVDVDTGAASTPLGERPQGLILYTADGHMSAQLARADGSGYLAYGGRFRVEADADGSTATVHHDVMMATVPELLASPQLRHAHLDGDRLTLAATTTGAGGAPRRATLTWRRR